jgi:hypothetical protein
MPRELCPGEQAPPRNSEGPAVPVEHSFEAFVGGTGI